MGFIEDELAEVRKLCENVVPGSRLVSCVRSIIRVELKRTDFKRLVVCLQFPENYPNSTILIELKSKTLHEKLLTGLSNVCEQEAKKLHGKAQVLPVIKFLRNFLDENPLSCCYEEINALKSTLNGDGDELKLRQKSSSISLRIVNRNYFLSGKVVVPDDYPLKRISVENFETNFPVAFSRHINAQMIEIARKCVEPPLRKLKPNEPPFKPQPSLLKAVGFLVDCVKRLPDESCQFCNKICFDTDPSKVEIDEHAPRHIERVYCGHLFHLDCLNKFMKTPPFGNKRCKTCGNKISHQKWNLSDRLAETRWAHEQARERELAEVEDFFK